MTALPQAPVTQMAVQQIGSDYALIGEKKDLLVRMSPAQADGQQPAVAAIFDNLAGKFPFQATSISRAVPPFSEFSPRPVLVVADRIQCLPLTLDQLILAHPETCRPGFADTLENQLKALGFKQVGEIGTRTFFAADLQIPERENREVVVGVASGKITDFWVPSSILQEKFPGAPVTLAAASGDSVSFNIGSFSVRVNSSGVLGYPDIADVAWDPQKPPTPAEVGVCPTAARPDARSGLTIGGMNSPSALLEANFFGKTPLSDQDRVALAQNAREMIGLQGKHPKLSHQKLGETLQYLWKLAELKPSFSIRLGGVDLQVQRGTPMIGMRSGPYDNSLFPARPMTLTNSKTGESVRIDPLEIHHIRYYGDYRRCGALTEQQPPLSPVSLAKLLGLSGGVAAAELAHLICPELGGS